MAVDPNTIIFFYSKTELLQNCPNAHFFRQKNSPNCFIFVEIQNSVHFRPQNNPFEQGHRGAEIGQIYRAEQQDCDQTMAKQHQSFLQNCFPEKNCVPTISRTVRTIGKTAGSGTRWTVPCGRGKLACGPLIRPAGQSPHNFFRFRSIAESCSKASTEQERMIKIMLSDIGRRKKVL